MASATEQYARQIGTWHDRLYQAWPSRRGYWFTFEHTVSGWKIYITASPSYGGRPSGSVQTHRFGIGSRPYICWDNTIKTLSDAQAVAALWADCTENYIATGKFEPPPGRPRPGPWF
ncbi:MAG: hypothetical protein LBD97_01475 [Bifidobacteriaceae bacterium]|jgi:hypothetical protein|nr:hypothetical protein [Bifidobacteriaceae bacterium]